jgi:hypothetical protein
MRALKYRCPVTLREVTTSIMTDDATLARMGALKIFASCPHCDGSHQVRACDAYVVAPRDAGREPAREALRA